MANSHWLLQAPTRVNFVSLPMLQAAAKRQGGNLVNHSAACALVATCKRVCAPPLVGHWLALLGIIALGPARPQTPAASIVVTGTLAHFFAVHLHPGASDC
jgi:hypothetical protein